MLSSGRQPVRGVFAPQRDAKGRNGKK